jgi:hypothetical protein
MCIVLIPLPLSMSIKKMKRLWTDDMKRRIFNDTSFHVKILQNKFNDMAMSLASSAGDLKIPYWLAVA